LRDVSSKGEAVEGLAQDAVQRRVFVNTAIETLGSTGGKEILPYQSDC
jgi:hypothetical protein